MLSADSFSIQALYMEKEISLSKSESDIKSFLHYLFDYWDYSAFILDNSLKYLMLLQIVPMELTFLFAGSYLRLL